MANPKEAPTLEFTRLTGVSDAAVLAHQALSGLHGRIQQVECPLEPSYRFSGVDRSDKVTIVGMIDDSKRCLVLALRGLTRVNGGVSYSILAHISPRAVVNGYGEVFEQDLKEKLKRFQAFTEGGPRAGFLLGDNPAGGKDIIRQAARSILGEDFKLADPRETRNGPSYFILITKEGLLVEAPEINTPPYALFY